MVRKRRIALVVAITVLAGVLHVYAMRRLPVDWDEPGYVAAARIYSETLSSRELKSLSSIQFNKEHPALSKVLYGAVLFASGKAECSSNHLTEWNLVPRSERVLPWEFAIAKDATTSDNPAIHRIGNWAVTGERGILAANDRALLDQGCKDNYQGTIQGFSCMALHRSGEESCAVSSWVRDLEIIRATSSLIHLGLVATASYVNPWAGFFLAVHSYSLTYTSQAMLEALPMLTAFLTVLFYIFARSRERRGVRVPYLEYGLSSAFLGATLAAKFPYAIVVGAILIDWFLPGTKNNETYRMRLAKVLGCVAITLLFFYLCNVFMWGRSLDWFRETIAFHLNFSHNQSVTTDYPWWQPLIWLSLPISWTGMADKATAPFLFHVECLVAVLAAFGFFRLWREQRIYALWLVMGTVFLLYWGTKWAQYILIIAVPLCFAASYGITYLVDEIKSRWNIATLPFVVTGRRK